MKSFLIACGLAVVLAGAVLRSAASSLPPALAPGSPDDDPAASVARASDPDWDALQALQGAAPMDPKAMSLRERFQWVESHAQQLREAEVKYYEGHSGDPRRWEAVVMMFGNPGHFIKEFKPEFDENPSPKTVVFDTEAREAWQKRLDQLAAALDAAPDAGPEIREKAAEAEVIHALNVTFDGSGRVDLAPLRAKIDVLLARYPQDRVLNGVVISYLQLLETNDPAAQAPFLTKLASGPNAGLRDLAVGKLRVFDAEKHPLDLKFVAADGRAVDLAKLRGKVVLIDFWATWCGPCRAELPNVIAAFRKYYDKGFEIISISLENSRLEPGDSPEEKTAKLEASKQQLLAFTQDHGMPWPQYFDGKYWDNDLARRYAIQSIPSMFLVDKQGLIVSTEARGPALEAAVEKYLSL